MIKDKKQNEENDRKDNNSGVSGNKDIENETNTHQKLKGVIQTAYHTIKTSKESSGKDEGSADEVYQRKEKGTNRQGERKYNNYNQNETKVTERLRTRSVSKEMNKSGDQLLTAQNSSNLEKKTKKIRNVLRDACPICDKHIKTGVQYGYCLRWFHFKCENTTEEQVSKKYSAEKQYICMQDQHQTFENTFQFQYQKNIEEIKELKEKYEHAKEIQMEMERIYDELKVKYQKETKNSQQLQREIDRLNQAKQTSEEVIKSLRNLTSIRIESVPDKENKLNHLQKNLERERGIAQIMKRDNVELKKEIIQTQTQQQKIQMENAELRREIMQIRAKHQQTQSANKRQMRSVKLMKN